MYNEIDWEAKRAEIERHIKEIEQRPPSPLAGIIPVLERLGYYEALDITADLPELERQAALIKGFADWIQTDRDEFLEDLRARGWTDDTESLLRALDPNITDADFKMFFEGLHAPEAAQFREMERLVGVLYPGQDVSTKLDWISQNWEAFQDELKTLAQNPELKPLAGELVQALMVEELTPLELDYFLALTPPLPTPEAVRVTEEELKAWREMDIRPGILQPAQTIEEVGERLGKYWDYRKRGGTLDYSDWEWLGMPHSISASLIGPQQREEALTDFTDYMYQDIGSAFLAAHRGADPSRIQRLGQNILAGAGAGLSYLGTTLLRLGIGEGLAQDMIQEGNRLAARLEPYVPTEEEEKIWWRRWTNPDWLISHIVPSMTAMAPLIVASLLVAAKAKTIVGIPIAATALPPLVKKIASVAAGGLGGAMLMRPMEGAMVASEAYEQAIARGMTQEEAWKAYDEVFLRNLNLLGLDAGQLALAIAPVPRGGNMVLRRLAALGLKAPVLGPTGALEEKYQLEITRGALGLPSEFDREMKDSMFLGAVMELGLGGTWSVFDVFHSRMTRHMSPDVADTYNEARLDALKQGLDERQSQVAGLNAMAETVAGHEHLQQEMSTLKAQSLEGTTSVEEPLAIPAWQDMIDARLRDTNVKRISEVLANRIPGMRRVIGAVDPQELVHRDEMTVDHIVARNVMGLMEMQGIGQNQSRRFANELSGIMWQPEKVFQWETKVEDGFIIVRSRAGKKWIKPEYKDDPEAGILDHMFANPDKYNLPAKVAEYFRVVKAQNERLLEFAKAHGVDPEHVLRDYFHRIVLGKYDVTGALIAVRGTPGKRGMMAKMKSFMHHRRAPTMLDGMKAGTAYGMSLAESNAMLTQEIYEAVGKKLFMENIESDLGLIGEWGLTPTDLLAEEQWKRMSKTRREKLLETRKLDKALAEKDWAELNPEQRETLRTGLPVFLRAMLTEAEKDALTKLRAVTLRAERHEQVPTQTLAALEKRFPELGKRLRNLVDKPKVAEQALRDAISRLERINKSLTTRLEKIKPVDLPAFRAELTAKVRAEVEAEANLPIPDEAKLVAAFKVMEYEDRLAVREALNRRLDEVGRAAFEQGVELETLNEFLKTDPVAAYRGYIGARKTSLLALVKKGELPESFTLKEAEMLMFGKKPLTIVKGRVPRAYVLDEMASIFHMTEEELAKRIESVYHHKQRAEDLKAMVGIATSSERHIIHMLDILNKVDTAPENIPVMEPVSPPEVAPEVPIPEQVAPEIAPPLLEVKQLWEMTNDELLNVVDIDIKARVIRYPKGGQIITTYPRYLNYKDGLDIFRQDAKRLALPAPIAPEVPPVPEPVPGMPEPGLQRDIFGFFTPFQPRGKGKITQMSMEDYAKLAKARQDAGLPPPDVLIKPQIEGIDGMEEATSFQAVDYETPPVMTEKERAVEFKALKAEIKALLEEKKADAFRAKAEKAERLKELRGSAPIGFGYIQMSGFSGKAFSQEVVDQVNSFFGHKPGHPVMNFMLDVEGLGVQLGAQADISWHQIQGQPALGLAVSYLVSPNPKMRAIGAKMMGAWFRAYMYGVIALVNPEVAYRALNKQKAVADRRVASGGTEQVFEAMETLERKHGLAGFTAKLLHRLPLDPLARFEVAWLTPAEYIRNAYFEALEADAAGKGFLLDLAQFTDRMTGQVSTQKLGVPQWLRWVEKVLIFFSPRYLRACLAIVGYAFSGGYKGALARRTLAGMTVTIPAFLVALQMGVNLIEGKDEKETWDEIQEIFGIHQDPITGAWDWRPRRHFMAVRVGNTYWGLGGFWYSLLTIARATDRAVEQYGDREGMDVLRIMLTNPREIPLINWWWARTSVTTRTLTELLITQRDFLGFNIETPQQYARYIGELFTPFWMREFLEEYLPWGARRPTEAMFEAEKKDVLARLGGAFLGLRVLEVTAFMDFVEKAEGYIRGMPENEILEGQKDAWRKGELSWEHLDADQRDRLLARHADLQDMWDRYKAESTMRQSPLFREMFGYYLPDGRRVLGVFEQPTVDFYNTLGRLFTELQNDERDTRELRQAIKGYRDVRAGIFHHLRNDPRFRQAFEDMDDAKKSRLDRYEWEFDLALDEYETMIYDPGGWWSTVWEEPDWDERERLVQAFIEKWGIEVYDRIRQIVGQRMRDRGAPEWYVRHLQDIDKLGRGYWDLPREPITEVTLQDYAKDPDVVPAEFYVLWREWLKLDTDAEREAFIAEHPDMARDWRAEHRLKNPEDDARLALWGYGGRLQSMEAYEILEKWGQELGIPLKQMGLGLPTRPLIDNYFEYNKLVNQFGGASAEARLYRLEHQLWDAWGRDNWGWKEIDDKPQVLRISVQWREKDKEYDALDPNKREDFLAANLDYHKARRRRDAYRIEFPEELIDKYVDWHVTKRTGYDDDRFLMQNPDFYEAMFKAGIWTERRDFSKIPSERFEQYDAKYKALPVGDARLRFRLENPWFDEEGVNLGRWKPAEWKRLHEPHPLHMRQLQDDYGFTETQASRALAAMREGFVYEDRMIGNFEELDSLIARLIRQFTAAEVVDKIEIAAWGVAVP